MAVTKNNQVQASGQAVPDESHLHGSEMSFSARFKRWLMHDSPSWMISALFHTILLLIVGLFMGGKVIVEQMSEVPLFESTEQEKPPEKLDVFDPTGASEEPSELTTESLTLTEPPGQEAQEAIKYDDSDKPFEMEGGGTISGSETGAGGLGFNIKAAGLGPMLAGKGGADSGKGTGTGFGKGGAGTGFGGRGQGQREAMLARGGGTKQTERAVAAALNWLARHQNNDGTWSIDRLNGRCTDKTCNGGGNCTNIAAGTALGLLPFLAAGQTHQSRGPYQTNIKKAVNWFVSHQGRNGDLSAAGPQQMYTHGLATIALCEAYGMTNDSHLRMPAQSAVQFILAAQNEQGGWRYTFGTPESDLSVFGWQMMALKSGIMANLTVDPAKVEQARKWLGTVEIRGDSQKRGRFMYEPGRPVKPCVSSIGLLMTQYLGATKSDPTITGGVRYLMDNLPDPKARDTYYWYYATQVMHNMCDKDWDTWNRKMRKLLVETQCKTGCATGSWDPASPSADAWGREGGRLMVTSLSALTLEVYYRYLPLYQLDQEKEEGDSKKTEKEKSSEKSSAKKE